MHACMGNFPLAMTSCDARASGGLDANKVEGGECTYTKLNGTCMQVVYCNTACDCGLFAVSFASAVVFGEHPGLLFFENTFIIIRNDVV